MNKENALKNYEALKALAEKGGASLFGVADVTAVKNRFYIEPKSAVEGLDYGISIGVRLSGRILETVVNEPSKLYAFHYKRINSLLDETALKLSDFIQNSGYSALPIPASLIEDWQNQRGAVSHKMVGHLAGVGYVGRSALLVNPKFGAQVRYATILTDFPLKADAPDNSDCGECRECAAACPVKAVKDDAKDFNMAACRELLKAFANKPSIGHSICGICVKVCKGVIPAKAGI
jgi:epoxyqueuosine reductase